MKRNILITSGGTTEQIDAVRGITNISTGKLGSIIAAQFAAEPTVGKIYYVCGKKSIQPQTDKLEVIYVDSVSSLEDAVREVCGSANIDVIIHSMAVSDYRVASVTSAAKLAELTLSNLDSLHALDPKAAEDAFVSLVGKSESVIQGDGKISSNVDDMILLMERTPKVISLFQTIAPHAKLVGFKLLDHAPHETLIDRGYQVLRENKCTYVLANDLRDITGVGHIGYLIDKDRNYTKYETKAEIAAAIIAALL